MALKQEVFLTVHDSPVGGEVVLNATGLRTDFDIRHIPEFSRASFTIYNLNDVTIKRLMSGDRYVTLKTRLHGGKVYTLANRFFVNNAVDELKLPNRITTLYCFDTLRKEVLERPVDKTSQDTSLNGIMRTLLGNTPYKLERFPKGYVDEPGRKSSRPVQANSVQQCLRNLGEEFNFVPFTIDGGITAMYMPDLDNVDHTTLPTVEPLVLVTRSMRSNPKIGIANASIHSNLDGRIKPTTVLDLSQLLTVGTDTDETTLQLTEDYLSNFTNYSRYQAFAVTHVGSTHTAEWSTKINALSPTKGKLMSTVTWANM